MFLSRSIVSSLMCIGFAAATIVSAENFTPPQTPRKKFNMNQNWLFIRSDDSGASAVGYSDASWNKVHLPHNFQDVSITGGRYYRGVGWYRKHFSLDETFRGKRITVYFEGAMTVAECWINGNRLPTHYGGFSPFCYDITGYCNFGATENVLAIRLSNEYQKKVPPEKPDGSSIDFEMFGGIYRDVWLIVTDNLFVPEGIHAWADEWKDQGGHFITFSDVSPSSASVTVRTWVKNASGGSVDAKAVTVITDAQNRIVQSSESTVQAVAAGKVVRFVHQIRVPDPSLWYPWAPYLYTVHTIIYNGEKAADCYSTRIGIRSISFDRSTGMKCNGVSVKLLGLNRHQTWPFVGHAVPNIQQRRDAQLLKEASCNFVRCSHYLQDDAFMDACDELGIMLWVETPGWHCCNNDGLPSTDETWRRRHFDETRFMVRTARNHPCVAIWAPAINEARSDPSIEKPLNDLCHQEDSSRMTSAARAGWQHPSGSGSNIYDVYGDNQFTPGSIPLSNPDNATHGYINTEHTGHTYEDYSNRQANSESDLLSHAWKHAQMTAEARDRGAWVAGGMGWCAFDYYTGGSIRFHGVMDLMHYPKFAFWFYRSQSAADNYDGSAHPFVKIANWYTEKSPLNRDVYHNCEQVRLYRNGTLIATQVPSRTLNLAHGVTTFENVSFQKGMLTVEGLIGNVVVARDTARTPGAPAAIRLTADPPRLEANGGDFSRVTAQIVDSNGTYIPYNGNSIRFEISGPGTLIGDNPFKAQSGVAMNLAKVQLVPGTITVTASSSGLASGRVNIEVGPLSTAVLSPGTTSMPGVTPLFKKSWVIVKSFSNVVRLDRFTNCTPADVGVYNLQGRLAYRVITDKHLIDISATKALAPGIRILEIKTLSH